MVEITLNDLKDLSVDTLVSFFDGETHKSRRKLTDFIPYFQDICYDYAEIFTEDEPIQVDGNLLNLTIDLIGTANRTIVIESKDDIVKFIQFYSSLVNVDFMISYNDILLNCGGKVQC